MSSSGSRVSNLLPPLKILILMKDWTLPQHIIQDMKLLTVLLWEGSFTYRIFATEEELLDYTRRITGREIEDVEEAKKLIAESQVKGVAGHEAAHHAFYRMLDEEERIFFTDYVWSTDDEALVKAREFIGSRPVYAKTSEISEELYQSIIANEVFAYRLDFNMQGIGLHSDLNVLPLRKRISYF